LLVGVIVLLLALALVLMRYFDSLHQRAKDLALAGTVFQSSQQGIIVTNTRGDIVRVNPAYCRITGYSEAELLGKNPRILKSGLQDAAFYQSMWASLKAKGRWQGEIKNRRKNGEYYVQWVNIDAISGEQGEDLFVGIASDISELVDSREQLSNLAYFDTLTGLPNRALFQDRLRQAMIQTRREHAVMALVFVDLDNFKAVNDTLGHAIGDELLVEVARRLHERVRESDTVARLGGDEFAIILMDAKGAEEMVRIATHLVEALSVPYKLSGYDVAGGASLGITFYPIDAMTPEELLKNADVAMYRAKERGRNNFQFFTGDMAAGLAENMRIENGLRRAMEAGELSLFYQPQFTPDGRMLGCGSADALAFRRAGPCAARSLHSGGGKERHHYRTGRIRAARSLLQVFAMARTPRLRISMWRSICPLPSSSMKAWPNAWRRCCTNSVCRVLRWNWKLPKVW
jgi:diguanylate cyclase (GGDEF)-like protein/PAS domain S-box-containing protein